MLYGVDCTRYLILGLREDHMYPNFPIPPHEHSFRNGEQEQ